MPLTPAEEAELQALQSSPQVQGASQQGGSLSPDEEKELAQLQGQQGPTGLIEGLHQSAKDPMLQKVMTGITSGGVGEVMAPLGGLLSGAATKGFKGLSNFLTPAAARAGAVDLVKNEAELGPAVADKVSQAKEQFTKTQVSPRMTEQYSRAGEQSIPFNPDDFKGIHPKIDSIVDQISQGGVKEIPMKDALNLRASLNDKTLFKDLGPYSEQVAAKQTHALEAGNKLRDTLSSVDPNIGALSDELRDAYSLRNSVTKSAGQRPISSVSAGLGTDKGSLISQFDNAAGTDLRQFGQNLDLAKERLGGSSTGLPLSKAGVIKRAVGVVPRGYDALAQLIKPGADAAASAMQTPAANLGSSAALQALIQNRNKTGDRE